MSKDRDALVEACCKLNGREKDIAQQNVDKISQRYIPLHCLLLRIFSDEYVVFIHLTILILFCWLWNDYKIVWFYLLFCVTLITDAFIGYIVLRSTLHILVITQCALSLLVTVPEL